MIQTATSEKVMGWWYITGDDDADKKDDTPLLKYMSPVNGSDSATRVRVKIHSLV